MTNAGSSEREPRHYVHESDTAVIQIADDFIARKVKGCDHPTIIPIETMEQARFIRDSFKEVVENAE